MGAEPAPAASDTPATAPSATAPATTPAPAAVRGTSRLRQRIEPIFGRTA
jgi:hypothetical protein